MRHISENDIDSQLSIRIKCRLKHLSNQLDIIFNFSETISLYLRDLLYIQCTAKSYIYI